MKRPRSFGSLGPRQVNFILAVVFLLGVICGVICGVLRISVSERAAYYFLDLFCLGLISLAFAAAATFFGTAAIKNISTGKLLEWIDEHLLAPGDWNPEHTKKEK